jgi:RNA 2',3'-cyclic 3'-phosphodiesterase
MPESLRLFVAIELPGAVREALSRLQHELSRRGLEKLRWVRPEGIHLTLKFLGETPVGRVAAIEGALRPAVERVRPHQLSFGTLGAFHQRSAPRVLWVDLAGDIETLRDLQRRVEKPLNDLGFAPEARGFSPHLTIARVRPEMAREVEGPVRSVVPFRLVEAHVVPVNEVSLMRSTLRPRGAVYERVAAFPLGVA